jgi:phenylpropionate dioxygenase-like ring-hydroxylating dioxygenase large terminal subunit
MDVSKIKVYEYPCKEINGTIWVYIPQNKLKTEGADNDLPNLLLAPDKKFLHVETVMMPTNIDHSVIGLIDPAHVTFVHQSWFWRSSKNLKLKEKSFEPFEKGFIMKRHKPSSNSKGYSVLKGGTSTEINFQIPGNRLEHIQVGKNEIISITTLTPVDENQTELNHIFYTTIGLAKALWTPLKRLGKTFIGQDLGVFQKLKEGLDTDPKLMLLGDPDVQARWYYELKKNWTKSVEEGIPFENNLPSQTLRWIT